MTAKTLRRRVVIESPYAGNIVDNEAFALSMCAMAAKQGYAPFASHLFYPQFLRESLPADRAVGLQCGMAWLEAADEVWVCTPYGVGISPGMQLAITYAKFYDKPMFRVVQTSDGQTIKYGYSGG